MENNVLLFLNIFYYIIVFAMGTVFGSFFTLAVYRLPLHKDITHERSFCPNCNHRLEFLDMIPIWSYIFLGGKCRYCGNKIRPRYLILEILSGLVFLISFMSYKISLYNINIFQIVQFVFFIFTYISLIIIGFIDKEHHFVHTKTLLFGTIFELIHILVNIFVFNIFSIYNITLISALLIQAVIAVIYKAIGNKYPISFYMSLFSILTIIIINYIV